jgi:pimeloyl-ACP methyl ester carboxylesterase
MAEFVRWNSRPLDEWARKYAEGDSIDLPPGGRRTHFIKRGQGDPLLLIHGFNQDWHTWTANVDALAERFRVLALDLWGQGFSTREPLDYGYALFEEQVRAFMDALGLEKASLVGHSMGGGTAITFVLQNRRRVDKLVLVASTGIPSALPFRAKVFQLPGVAELLLSLPTDLVRRKNLLDYWIHNNDLLTGATYREFTWAQKVRGSTEAVLAILRRDFFNTLGDEIRALGQLHIPTLIVWGREDRTLPLRSGQDMHRLLPGSRLEVIDDAGHLVSFDRPGTFNRLALEFL